jgi:hypothetical protein
MRYHSMIADRAGAKTIGCVYQGRVFISTHTSSRLVGVSFGIQYFLFIVGYHGSKFSLPL